MANLNSFNPPDHIAVDGDWGRAPSESVVAATGSQLKHNKVCGPIVSSSNSRDNFALGIGSGSLILLAIANHKAVSSIFRTGDEMQKSTEVKVKILSFK